MVSCTVCWIWQDVTVYGCLEREFLCVLVGTFWATLVNAILLMSSVIICKQYLKSLVWVLLRTESVSIIKCTLSQHSWSTPAIWPPLNFHTMFVSSLPWRHESAVEDPLLGKVIQANKWISLDMVSVTSQTLKRNICVYRSVNHFSAVYYIFFNFFVCGCVFNRFATVFCF